MTTNNPLQGSCKTDLCKEWYHFSEAKQISRKILVCSFEISTKENNKSANVLTSECALHVFSGARVHPSPS